ncbi:hypothetical protein V498_03088 [Pseudogymnoascus sp. VKM F-4517 (FW-2822)]|nr:hypothetical protein V498_03088 [Pseudogymnoascus sp. VKM F-4517 (FW-2822)]
MTDPERRRRRPTVYVPHQNAREEPPTDNTSEENSSCALCKRRKIRCNREMPCSNCQRSRNGTCVYENHFSARPRRDVGLTPERGGELGRESNASRRSEPAFSPLPTPSSSAPSPAPDVPAMQRRIRELESQLAGVSIKQPPAPQPPVELAPTLMDPFALQKEEDTVTTSTKLGGTFHVHNESSELGTGREGGIPRSVTHKTRVFGQSHWINGIVLFLGIPSLIESHFRGETSRAVVGIQRCKSLARTIKFQRTPAARPLPPILDLPPKDVADSLIECYLHTIESVYRIVHIPTFRRDYAALWASGTPSNTAFLVQLKLVLAIGAAMYDTKFSLRTSAIRWVYEAQTWLSDPAFKSRLNIQTLQISLLLLFAREATGIGEDMVWVSAGSLLRTAIHMGLNRDPSLLPTRSFFAAEMRRRLWNTILEAVVQTSLLSGGPPLLSLSDFNTAAPGNFADEQLTDDGSTPAPDAEFTQTSVAIALHATFPLRLAVAKFLNDFGAHGTYDETLRLDAELRTAYRALCQSLQGYTSSTGPSPSRFALRIIDFQMLRYQSALHVPFFGPSLKIAAYAYSRTVVVENSLRMWHIVCPPSPGAATEDEGEIGKEDLVRLAMCGSGFYCAVSMQAALLIAVELRTQLQEATSLSPPTLRPDLLAAIEQNKAWLLRRIEAGETNIKGYLLLCVVTAQIDALSRGLDKEEMLRLCLEAAEESEEVCFPLLEGMVAQGRGEGGDSGILTGLGTPEGGVEDWEFMVSDALFELGGVDGMSWMLGQENG